MGDGICRNCGYIGGGEEGGEERRGEERRGEGRRGEGRRGEERRGEERRTCGFESPSWRSVCCLLCVVVVVVVVVCCLLSVVSLSVSLLSLVFYVSPIPLSSTHSYPSITNPRSTTTTTTSQSRPSLTRSVSLSGYQDIRISGSRPGQARGRVHPPSSMAQSKGHFCFGSRAWRVGMYVSVSVYGI